MRNRINLALLGATTTLALVPAVAGAATKVSVRVEGVNKTLLPATSVRVPTKGSIRKGGAPKGICPADSLAGALDVATKHRWTGYYSPKDSSLGIAVIGIFGEVHNPFAPHSHAKYYWEEVVNNLAAQAGACSVVPKRGDRVLFAAVPITDSADYPVAIRAPRSVRAGQAFTVKVVYFDGKGKSHPLKGAHVTGSGISVTTGAGGTARVIASASGTLRLTAAHGRAAKTKTGYIRGETAVHVLA